MTSLITQDRFSLVRQWMGEQRESFCPPSSYTAKTRASYTIIDAAPEHHDNDLLGQGEVFHRLLECNSEGTDTRPHVIRTRDSIVDYFQQSYATQTPYATVYWHLTIDVMNAPHMRELITCMLNHPEHPVPMIVLRLPDSFSASDEGDLVKVALHHAILTLDGATERFLLLAGTRQFDVQKTQPCYQQIASILNHPQNHLRQRLRQIMNGQLWMCPNAQKLLFVKLMELYRQNLDDEQIYDGLREYYHNSLLLTSECKALRHNKSDGSEMDGRAESRVRDITQMIGKERVPVSSILDIGCGEGSITSAIGKALNLRPSRIHGCDVREPASTAGFTFQHITDQRYKLPYDDEQFPCVFALMSLHHIEHVEDTISEIKRILRPGGVLIIREHDLSCPELSVVIDVMHGLYARVWSNPPEQPSFCDTYFAQYLPRAEWTRLMRDAGLVESAHSPSALPQPWDKGVHHERNGFIRNPFQHLYSVYRKPA